ncbi:MAG: ABC transporter ATP-binding protein/permease [Burkholderiales bacterium]|nr:ABC transporter ATP-binding protein/permease [Burkholderiales bacterium]
MDSGEPLRPGTRTQSHSTAAPLPGRPATDRAAAETDRYRFRLFWETASGFWRGESRRLAWLLVYSLALLVVLDILVQYGINVWNRHIFDALEQRDAREVLIQALVFPVLATLSVALGVALVYGRMTMQREWRGWTTRRLVERWLANGRYYQLNLVRGDHQVPEYRISEDVRIATDPPVDFAVGIVSSVLSAVTFIGVLWVVGGSLTATVAGTTVTIPGFLVVAAVIYAVIASIAMLLTGRRFVRVSMQMNQAEAEYRYALTRVRESGESIALLGGEQEERAGLEKALQFVLRSWREVLGQHLRTTVVSHGSGLVAPVVPLVLAAPKFLDGTMTLGEVMQTTFAFVAVQSAFSWLVHNFPSLADWTASVRRAASLLASLHALEEAEHGGGVGRITRRQALDAALRLHNLSVTLDDGTGVVSDAEVMVATGEKVLVVGESGTGKSTLVRAIAGLWPWGEGEVVIQSGARLLLLPQKPYVPLGSLRRATTYPLAPATVSDEGVKRALVDVGLGYLVERLDAEESWEQVLSGGEKQRLAFARLLIHQPDIVVIDEGTAALDPASQAGLMQLLVERLPRTTVISVGHRPELEAFHDRELVFERRPGGARLVADKHLPIKPRVMLGLPLAWARRMRGRGARKTHDARAGTAP